MSVASVIQRNDVYIYGEHIFVGNKTYDINNYGNVLPRQQCSEIPFIHVLKKRNCFPVYIRSKICAGLCSSTLYPGLVKSNFQSSDHYKSDCVACAPVKYIKKKVHTICKKKNRTGKRKYRVVIKIAKVIKKCSCQKLKCPSSSDRNE